MKKLAICVLVIFLLTLPLTVCSCSGNQDSWQQGYDEGYSAGHSKGLEDCPNGQGGEDITPPPVPTPDGALTWDEAINHVGERASVCGKVAGTRWSTGSNGKPTFINIGEDYPSSARFVVLIWVDSRSNFSQPPEDYYLGKTICIEGLIQEYDGIAEIVVTSPDEIEEY